MSAMEEEKKTTESLQEEVLSLRTELQEYQTQLSKCETKCAVQATEIHKLEELLCKKDGLGETVVELKHANTELETQVEEMENQMEELEDELQTIEDAKQRLEINHKTANNNFDRELAKRDKQKEEDMQSLVKQLQEMELELEEEIKQRNTISEQNMESATKSQENQGASNSDVPSGKLIIQQCLSARLQVKPQEDDIPAEFVEVGRGIVVYVCFLKGATQSIVDKMVKTALTIRLSTKDGKTVSVSDLPGDVLIVPQATLGGKAKGRVMQYHSNIAKDEGLSLYTAFCDACQTEIKSANQEAENRVKHGTYGNLQVLAIDTNGPYTHTFDF